MTLLEAGAARAVDVDARESTWPSRAPRRSGVDWRTGLSIGMAT
jgi:hypothetical protein